MVKRSGTEGAETQDRGPRGVAGMRGPLRILAAAPRLLSGDVTAESAPGVGSTFRVRLPLRNRTTIDAPAPPGASAA